MSEVADIQLPFKAWLDKLPVVYIWQRADKATSTEKGVPDFVIIRGNYCLLIECKTEKGPVRPEQAEWHRRAADTGGKVHVCRSLAECVDVTTAWMTGIGTGAIVHREQPSQQLYRFGNSVCSKNPDGTINVLRPVKSPSDNLLPPV